MVNKKAKLVVMCCDGLYQRYLIKRLADEFNLIGLVLYVAPHKKSNLFKRIVRYRDPITFVKYLQARLLMNYYIYKAKPVIKRLFYINDAKPILPKDVPMIRVSNVNNKETVEFVYSLIPNIICVNGTNLLREPMLSLIPFIPYGIINLHTGLSPYSRGGNCNLFMLLERHPEMVGVTIHHIDRGIDSGDIIISARPKLDPSDNYEIIEAKTFHLGVDMMVVAIHQLLEGRAKKIKQWEAGKLFLKRTGYVYSPYHRVEVNRLLKNGLIREYLQNQQVKDANVKLVGKYVYKRYNSSPFK